MKRKFIILIVLAVFLFGLVAFFRFGNLGTETLWEISKGGQWFLPLVIVAALIDSVNPCAFSILILTVAFLMSLGKVRSDILKIGGSYILGIFFTYIAIGLGILQTLHFFNTPHFMAKLGASLLIVLGGINVINEFFPSFPIKLRIPQAAHRKMAEFMEKGSVPTAFVLGAFVALCEFPCTGGPYLMILGMLHDQATYFRGFGYLVLYNLVFVVPLVVILLIAADKVLLEKVQTWKKTNTRALRLWGGLAMVLLGFLIFTL